MTPSERDLLLLLAKSAAGIAPMTTRRHLLDVIKRVEAENTRRRREAQAGPSDPEPLRDPLAGLAEAFELRLGEFEPDPDVLTRAKSALREARPLPSSAEKESK